MELHITCLLLYIYIYTYMYLVRDILNIFNLHSTTPSKIKCIFSLKNKKGQKVVRNDYLHTSSRFRRTRVPLKVKVAASSRAPASHRPGVCVHMHTQVCTHTCIHHSKINEKEKGRKRKGRRCQLALPGPKADGPVGALGQG